MRFFNEVMVSITIQLRAIENPGDFSNDGI